MKRFLLKKNQGGYTIIETMIAVSLFIIIVVAGVGALLNANLVHNKSSDMRSIMDNLTFIMEDMSRHLRTGYNYRCYDQSDPWQSGYANAGELDDPRSCASGKTIVFEEAYGDPDPKVTNDQWVYLIGEENGQTNIYKSTDGGKNFVRLNDSAVSISPASGISVLGAEHPIGNAVGKDDKQQPLVTIRLMGDIKYKDLVTPFSLQTSVSQRLIDITP